MLEFRYEIVFKNVHYNQGDIPTLVLDIQNAIVIIVHILYVPTYEYILLVLLVINQ